MFLLPLLRYALVLLLPASLILTSYLYLYPVFSLCAFSLPPPPSLTSAPSPPPPSAFLDTLRDHISAKRVNGALKAPFRLLALGDPQLEGDTSIPGRGVTSFPHLTKVWREAILSEGTQRGLLGRVQYGLHDLVDFCFDDIPTTLEAYRKRIDLLGNDFYLAHIYRTLHWWTRPTHVSVLGDLVGSQWINDDEFNTRGGRYWDRVFKDGIRVPDDITAEREDWNDVPQLADDAQEWRRRIINIAGNHDIGYAGDLTPERFERFERVFGRANYELRFQLPLGSIDHNSTSDETLSDVEEFESPEIRIVVLNDMNLDTPASSKELQDATYSFLNNIITTSHPVTRRALFTLVLTHIPLHKEAGTCVDAPFFAFHDTATFAYGVKEQNHLSPAASKGILEGIFGKSIDSTADGHGRGRNGIVLTGHDHEGCDVYHFINQSAPADADDNERAWQARRWRKVKNDKELLNQPQFPGLREITLRSMMGEFGGNAGLLSVWFDAQAWQWRYDFSTCALGVQHWWWAIHILDVVTVCAAIIYVCLFVAEKVGLLRSPTAPPATTRTAPTKRMKEPRTTPTLTISPSPHDNDSDLTPTHPASKRTLKKKRSRQNVARSTEPSPTPEPEFSLEHDLDQESETSTRTGTSTSSRRSARRNAGTRRTKPLSSLFETPTPTGTPSRSVSRSLSKSLSPPSSVTDGGR